MRALMLLLAFTLQSDFTNKDILELLKGGISSEIIVAKIQTSKCGFDTSTPALKQLKDAGASDAVMIALINCEKPAPVEKLAPKERGIIDLSKVKKIYVDEMGKSDDAERFRFMLEEMISSGGFVDTVSRPEDADAILKGVLSTQLDDGTTKARVTVRLKNREGVELWSEDYGTRLVFGRRKDSVKLRAEDVYNGLKSVFKKAAKNAGKID